MKIKLTISVQLADLLIALETANAFLGEFMRHYTELRQREIEVVSRNPPDSSAKGSQGSGGFTDGFHATPSW